MTHHVSRRAALRLGAALVGVAAVGLSGAGCSVDSLAPVAGAPQTPEELVAAAQAEGTVQLVAVSSQWANYGGVLKGFQETYGILAQIMSPDATSLEELQILSQLEGHPDMPDCLDTGHTYIELAQERGWLASFRPSTADTIPEPLLGPDNQWVGSYFGVMEVGVNPAAVPVPTSLDVLSGPEYRGKVSLPGDPRENSSAVAAVMTATLASAEGTLDDVTPGVEFFTELARVGNLVYTTKAHNALVSGDVGVCFDWNYNLANMSATYADAGVQISQFVPTEAAVGHYFTQAVTAGCPHPNAGRLWLEWLLSDAGAEQLALGGMVPARHADLRARDVLSAQAVSMLPQPVVTDSTVFPTVAQVRAAEDVIARQWQYAP